MAHAGFRGDGATIASTSAVSSAFPRFLAHVRDETYALALQRLVNQQQREPLAAMFGDATASSSDGQFFRAGGRGRAAASLNAHYGDDPGAKFYTHISSRYAPFYIKAIPATASEALYVLDALLYHQTE